MICQRSTHTDQASQDAGACFAALTIEKNVAHILKQECRHNIHEYHRQNRGINQKQIKWLFHDNLEILFPISP